jgi:hypothetical protein
LLLPSAAAGTPPKAANAATAVAQVRNVGRTKITAVSSVEKLPSPAEQRAFTSDRKQRPQHYAIPMQLQLHRSIQQPLRAANHNTVQKMAISPTSVTKITKRA